MMPVTRQPGASQFDDYEFDYRDAEIAGSCSDLECGTDVADAPADEDPGDPLPDLFPETLFDDLPKQQLAGRGPGHGDS